MNSTRLQLTKNSSVKINSPMFNKKNDKKMQEKMQELMPDLFEFTKIVKGMGTDRVKIDTPLGPWIFFGDEDYDLENLHKEIGAFLLAKGDLMPEDMEPTKVESAPKRDRDSETYQKMEEGLSKEDIDYTDIKNLSKKWGKDRVEKLAERMGFSCDWENNYLVKENE